MVKAVEPIAKTNDVLNLMIKDGIAKLVLIPLLGIAFPLCNRLVPFSTAFELHFLFALFFWLSFTTVLWQGVVLLTSNLRHQNGLRQQPILKLAVLILCTLLFATFISLLASLLWNKAGTQLNLSTLTFTSLLLYIFLAPLLSFSYEILFLHKEMQLDSKIVAQLDQERQTAEMQNLKNELDPHFIFNSLNSLLPLITSDTAKAHIFTTKLAQVYKYLLLNKEHELITLSEELRFIEDYFYLLQIRHENKLQLIIELNKAALPKILILPFALQILIENAIKHNHFSTEHPLSITIALHPHTLEVRNNNFTKPEKLESTHIGLKNLSARYKITSNQTIKINETEDWFSVQLPLIKTTL